MIEQKTAGAPTLDQQRAAHAWRAVERAIGKEGPHDEQSPKDFGLHARRLPARILTAGLGQALAFLAAKKKTPGLLAELNDWIAKRIPPAPRESSDLLERIIDGDSDFLRRATDEVQAYLVWLVRFAEEKGLTKMEESSDA